MNGFLEQVAALLGGTRPEGPVSFRTPAGPQFVEGRQMVRGIGVVRIGDEEDHGLLFINHIAATAAASAGTGDRLAMHHVGQ